MILMRDSGKEALLTVLLLELKAPTETPARSLAALSSLMPRARLAAARALELCNDPDAFLAYLVELFNDRGEHQAWKISAKIVDSVGELLAHGSPHLKARTALLLEHLDASAQKEWDQAWRGASGSLRRGDQGAPTASQEAQASQTR